MNTADMNIKDYLKELSSSAPIPGGGGVSALVGSLAASLGNMVCSLTIGKKKYADVENDIKEIADRLSVRRDKLVRLADKDAEVFKPLSAAYSLPHATDEEKAARDATIEPLLVDAAKAPEEVMAEAVSLLDDISFLAKNGSKLAISDAGCAAALVRATLSLAILNVKINTKMMKDRDKADKIDKNAKELYAQGTSHADKIYAYVADALN